MAKKTINVIYKVDDKELEEAKKTISGIEKEALDADQAIKKMAKDGAESGNKLTGSFGGLGKAIAAVGIVALAKQVFDFGKQVANITSEFQKFEAVLTNTLGSRSRAQLALAQIKEFAASTPFSVQELTSSFVKLANQGFEPTRQEMTKLGDLASAMGKGFDQLTEAIIDAQTGEFERLKEFGIRASKEGDRVTFTFKGVQTQTEFTADAIRQYVLSLGELSGVSGGMAAISETLGGKISNLGDSWDTFLNTLGEGNKGALSGTVTLMQRALEIATDLVKTTDQQRQEEQDILVKATLNRYKEFGTEQDKQEFRNQLWARLLQLQIEVAKARKDEKNANIAQYNQNIRDIEVLKTTIGLIGDEVAKENEQKAAKEANEKATKKLSAEEQKRIDQFNKSNAAFDGVIDREIELARIREKIAKDQKSTGLKEEIELQNRINNALLDAENEFRAEDANILKNNYADLEQQEQEHADNILRTRQFVFDASLNLISQLLLAEDNRIQKAIAAEQFFASQQTQLAGDNERRKTEIRIESDRKIEQLQKQQAEREKQIAIRRMIIESAINAIKALGTPPVPNFLLAGVTAAFGVAQVAIARSQGFAEGVIDLKGPGTTKSDSIPARLSRGESVITAEATASSRNLLEAIQDRKIDDSLLTKMAKGGGAQVNIFDDSKLIKAIEKNKVNVSREAYTLYETRQIGNNLRVKTRSKIQGY